ncbi:hypothetical protein Glove_192g41 [Diversispora epigaea]|uniref:Uncharacterized protein n=1 Tax=Diversispora epigaea TaxID=1348612 RepID=A0A397IR72_9GLOM|nr:hypothetical protein Glove_192g41 [Diversispora epigaea]
MKESISSVVYILSIILYSDAITTDILVSKENLNNTRLRNDQMVLRNKENMLQYYNNDTTEKATLLTADNYRNIMKVMVFVVDDLLNKDLSEIYVKWNEMYLLSRQETFKESDLKNFQEAIEKWANL